MKKLISVFLLLSSLNSLAQSVTKIVPNRIIISGKISDSLIGSATNGPYIEFYSNYNRENPESCKIIPLHIENRKFSVTIEPENDISYFDLVGVGARMIRSVTFYQFMIARGDSIFMDIAHENDVRFSGLGSEKLNFQHWAGKLIVSDLKLLKSEDSNSLLQMMVDNKKRAIWHMALSLDSLNKDSSLNDNRIKDLLRTNTASAINKDYLNRITLPYYFPDTTYLNNLKREVNFLITQQNGFVIIDPFLIKNSYMYVQYVFELNKTVAMIRSKSQLAPVTIIYNNIKSEYQGLLKDKLIPFCFLEAALQDPVSMKLLPEAISIVRDADSRRLLQQIEQAKTPGVRAYNFSFIGVKRQAIKLDDFQGKVVILKTYENGCVPCIALSEKLDPIAEYFKSRKDVVFLNVNGVQTEDRAFEAGVKLGKYGTKHSIYARTTGLGQRDTFFLHYKFTEFPSMLIIGKDGNVISANPTKPFDERSKKDFIALIESNL
ncbi:MAG: AhpC/TSA family protein [Mucilaginibacter sp.]|nr:AhpC/TSA family protein [Mucilaginibacter sp.]